MRTLSPEISLISHVHWVSFLFHALILIYPSTLTNSNLPSVLEIVTEDVILYMARRSRLASAHETSQGKGSHSVCFHALNSHSPALSHSPEVQSQHTHTYSSLFTNDALPQLALRFCINGKEKKRKRGEKTTTSLSYIYIHRSRIMVQ